MKNTKKNKLKQKNEFVNPDSSTLGMFVVPMSIVFAGMLIFTSILISGTAIMNRQRDLEAKIDRLQASGGIAQQPQQEAPYNEAILATYAERLGVDKNKFQQCYDSKKYNDEFNKDNSDATAASLTGTPNFIVGTVNSDGIVNGYRIQGAYPYETFKTLFDNLLSGNTAAIEAALDADGTPLYPKATASIDDDPIEGDRNKAKIAMIEFSDYECPFCQRHFQETGVKIKSEYVDSGKIFTVFRDFVAVRSHNPGATNAALAGECIREQGGDKKYYEFHNLYFTNTRSNGLGPTN